MKNFKKITAAIISLLTLLTLLASCATVPGDNETNVTTVPADISESVAETTDDGKDENGYLKDDLPELDFGQKTVTMLIWSDHTMKEFFDDSGAPDFVGEAINSRNKRVEERLGLITNYVATPGNDKKMNDYIKKVEADCQASPSEYDLYASYSRTASQIAMRGLSVDLLSTDYFNLEMPWWPNALMKECVINNRLYFCSGDISTNLLWMMTGMFFNKQLIKDHQIEKDPYMLVNDNEWTLDKFIEITKDIYVDNGNQVRDTADTYGYVIYTVNIDAFQTSAGIVSIIKDSNDTFTIADDFHNDKMLSLVQKCGDFIKENGVLTDSGTGIRDVFNEQRALFISDRVFIVAGKDNSGGKFKINFDFGIVPVPKYSADQEEYMTSVGHPFTMYSINNSSDSIAECSALLEALASENYRSITPKVFEAAMKVRYASDSDAGRMYDIIRNGICFDIGRLFSDTFNNSSANLFRKSVIAGGTNFSASYKSSEKAIKQGLEKLIEAFNK